jgi:hypothetical protein
MKTRLNDLSCAVNFKEFERIFDNSLSSCLSSKLNETLKGKRIIFCNDEKSLVPIDGWGIEGDSYCATPLTTIQPIMDNTLVSAIDSSSIKIAETDEGSLYGVKCGIAISISCHAVMHFKIGPMLLYLSEETIKHSELDHRLVRVVLTDNDSAKRLIRVRVERAVLLGLSARIKLSIILIDGSLKSSLFENKHQSLKHVAENCSLGESALIGITKNTKLKILGRISTPLAKIKGPAYMDVELIIKSLIRNSFGNNLLVKFSENSPILRADVVATKYDKDESLGKLLGNDSIAHGYPETLRLAHHISTFTKTEVCCLRGHVLNNYEVTQLPSEDIRKTLLGSILA